MDHTNNHYFRADETGRVVTFFSDAYKYDSPEYTPREGDVKVGEGERQFSAVITNEREQFIYKIINGEVIERSAEELEAEWAALPPEPKSPEKIRIEELEATNSELLSRIEDVELALAEIFV